MLFSMETAEPTLAELIMRATDRDLTPGEIADVNHYNKGADRHLGTRYTRIGPTGVRARLKVGPEHLQPFGLVNGGVFALLAESTGSIMAIIAAKAVAVGVNNNTDFLRSVTSGVIEVEAVPVHVGGTTQVVDITMKNNGQVVAKSRLRTLCLRS